MIEAIMVNEACRQANGIGQAGDMLRSLDIIDLRLMAIGRSPRGDTFPGLAEQGHRIEAMFLGLWQ